MASRHALVRAAILLLVIAVAGCGKTHGGGDGNDPAKTTKAGPDLLPPLEDTCTIVLEAEDGEVEAPFRVEVFVATRHAKGLQRASGGKCVGIPDGVNPKDPKVKAPYKGRLALTFTVPQDGKYYIFPRAWWYDQCGNSFIMKVDDGVELDVSTPVTKATEKTWEWIKLPGRRTVKRAGATIRLPRAFKLKKGKHTLTFLNREDGPKLDQVYITDDPEDSPKGLMKKTE